MEKRPNILFLMTDQQRFDLSGFMYNGVVRTPNLDRLAQDSVVFENAYTPSPICVPGRQSMMSGQLPQTCNCTQYGQDLVPNYMTFARRFSQYAYNTVVCGKLHHTGTDQYQGWLKRIGQDNGVDVSFLSGKREDEFAHYSNRRNQWWSWTEEIKRAGVGRSPHQRIDEYAVEGALGFIDEWFTSPFYDKEKEDLPLLLKASLRLPHYPYFCDEEKFIYYLNRVEPFVDESYFGHPLHPEEWERVTYGEDVTEREVRRATAAYYGMMETADAFFGQIVDRLEYVGQDLDDWIVVFTSDHGDLLGQHRMWMKTKFFEGSVRVPLFIRYPRHYEARRVRKNVNLCDLFATLCDLAGEIEIPDGLDSRSLAPLMRGAAKGWDNETVSQLGDNLMIKQDDLKYMYFGEDVDEILIDLAADPGETQNAINDNMHATAVARFRRRCAELGFGPHADPSCLNAGYRAHWW